MLGWDGVDSAVSLSRFPVVGTLLLDCHNVDVEGVGPVSTSIEPAKVSVELRRIADNDGNTLRFEPELGIAVESTNPMANRSTAYWRRKICCQGI